MKSTKNSSMTTPSMCPLPRCCPSWQTEPGRQWRIEILCDDRMARGLWRRASKFDRPDDQSPNTGTTNTCTISQYAALEALTGPQNCIERMRRAFAKRRDQIVSRLNQMPGVSCFSPRGAFYVFPRVSELIGNSSPRGRIDNDVSLCDFLLEEAGVACVPGTGFGAPDICGFPTRRQQTKSPKAWTAWKRHWGE